jgi:hypothetical protein
MICFSFVAALVGQAATQGMSSHILTRHPARRSSVRQSHVIAQPRQTERAIWDRRARTAAAPRAGTEEPVFHRRAWRTQGRAARSGLPGISPRPSATINAPPARRAPSAMKRRRAELCGASRPAGDPYPRALASSVAP